MAEDKRKQRRRAGGGRGRGRGRPGAQITIRTGLRPGLNLTRLSANQFVGRQVKAKKHSPSIRLISTEAPLTLISHLIANHGGAREDESGTHGCSLKRQGCRRERVENSQDARIREPYLITARRTPRGERGKRGSAVFIALHLRRGHTCRVFANSARATPRKGSTAKGPSLDRRGGGRETRGFAKGFGEGELAR